MVDDATPPDALLVFFAGLVGLLLCQVLSPAAWALGNRYMRICLRQGVPADPMARIGRVLGMVGTLLWGSAALIGIVVFMVGYAWTR